MKPMLAAVLDWERLRYPVYVSPKLDGIRCIIQDGKPWSRSAKQLPNRHLRKLVAAAGADINHLDGELVVGSSTAPNVFNRATSGIMSEMGVPNVAYLVFDDLTSPSLSFKDRLILLDDRADDFPGWVQTVDQRLCHTRDEVEEVEAYALAQGYEGVIVRSPSMPYKQGRSTVNQGGMLKLKRFVDAEAIVIGTQELLHNDNPAFINELGHTARSSHKAHQRPGNMLGALVVHSMYRQDVIFSIGSGFDFAQRKALWAERDKLPGRIVKYKSQPHGELNAPRFPIFLGFRNPIDMGE